MKEMYAMNEQIKTYLDKFPKETTDIFMKLRQLIYDSVSSNLEEKMWAKLPSYYVGEKFVRLIAFKDHINIEATAIIAHKNELQGYKITPKGMLQIYVNQEMPKEALKQIFIEALGE